ncbi:MAG: protein translocase subunit SecF [Patescibacteria group bacterium]|nr:MAG: protein translocase subunit SecF [Patescibacteria group bacterium]
MTYNIIGKSKLWLTISSILVIASVAALGVFGLKLGIDFTGGSLLEVRFFSERPSVSTIEERLSPLSLNSLTVQPVGENDVMMRFQEIDQETREETIGLLNEFSPVEGEPALEELRFEAVGPTVGQELRKKSIYATILVILAISLYIAWAFRRVSRPIASWKYGAVTLVSLFHDVVILLGVFAVLGHFYGAEINVAFLAAALTVLGYSVHDSIVVFDRIRENLPRSNDSYRKTVNDSINQSIVRSINTSVTVMVVLLSIIIMGGSSIYYFSIALFVGILFGTYSSIFLAAPLLVLWSERAEKNRG